MTRTPTEQEIANILRVLKGDNLAKTPGLVSEVRDLLTRSYKTERLLSKFAKLIADQGDEIVKLRERDRERELEVVKLKTRQRLMWKIITGGLTGATAVGGTVAGVVAAFSNGA